MHVSHASMRCIMDFDTLVEHFYVPHIGTWTQVSRMLLSASQRRNSSRAQREKDNREAESMLTVAGPKGDTEWERALDYVNFGFARPNGSDLSRMKGLLFSAKSKNVPIKSKA